MKAKTILRVTATSAIIIVIGLLIAAWNDLHWIQTSFLLVMCVWGLVGLFMKDTSKQKFPRCTDCVRQHRMDCPNSSKCYALENKPHFVKRGKSDPLSDEDLYGKDSEEYLKDQVGEDYYNEHYRE